MEIEDVTVSPS